jgi:hypothetical protein
MKRLFITCIALAVFTMAAALSAYSKVFQETYKVKEGSALDKAACSVCHVGPKGGKLNLYGKDIQLKMQEAKVKKLTPEILAKVEGLDSDKDGSKNIDEIKKDALPGVK